MSNFFGMTCCAGCGTPKAELGGPHWWHLNNYYGLSGTFCPTCYDKVSHGPQGKPVNEEAYSAILAKQFAARLCATKPKTSLAVP